MSNGPDLKVLDFPNNSLADIPQKLRDIADAIEEGHFGTAQVCLLVLETDAVFEVFGLGTEADGNRAHYLLSCAQRKLEKPFLESKGV